MIVHQFFRIALIGALLTDPLHAQDGLLDPTFGDNGSVRMGTDYVEPSFDMQVLPDDGILLAWGDHHPSTDIILAKLTANGQPLPGFGEDGLMRFTSPNPHHGRLRCAVAPSGKILVVTAESGEWPAPEGLNTRRFHADGTLDEDYGTDTSVVLGLPGWRLEFHAIALQPDEKLVICGRQWNDTAQCAFVARLNADGMVDEDFGDSGIRSIDFDGREQVLSAVAIQPDGRILLAGECSKPPGPGMPPNDQNHLALARLTTDGELDATFNGGTFTRMVMAGMALQERMGLSLGAAGHFTISGTAVTDEWEQRVVLLRFSSDGSWDVGFGNGGSATMNMNGMARGGHVVDGLGRILVGGNTMGMDEDVLSAWRFLPDGGQDNGFAGGGVLSDPDLARRGDACALQSDGRFLIAGRVGVNALEGEEQRIMISRYRNLTTDVQEADPQAMVGLWPNPVADRFELSMALPVARRSELELLDARGALVHRFNAPLRASAGPQRVTLEWPAHVGPGVYLLQVTGPAFRTSVPLVR